MEQPALSEAGIEKLAGRVSNGLICQLMAGLIFVVTLALIGANVEAGMNDDWSFVLTVRDLAATGHLKYNGWSAPLIGFQAYWGALFVKFFGFSFLAVRASSWTLTLLSIPVIWALLRKVELNETQAFFGLLMFLLSPLNLPNMAAFMTDVPAFVLFAAALLAAINAWEAADDREALWWVGATTLCSLLSGSVRQIYWLSGVCFLVVLAWARLRSARGRIFIAACLAVTVVFGWQCSHWLAAQPYVPVDDTVKVWKELPGKELALTAGSELFRTCVSVALMCIPFSVLLVFSGVRRFPRWSHFVIFPVAFGIVSVYVERIPWLGNTITQYGVTQPYLLSVGERPELLPAIAVRMLAAIAIASFSYSAFYFMRVPGRPGLRRFATLSVPFLLAYSAVLIIHAPGYGVYDRYVIPIVFMLSTLMLGIYARGHSGVGKAGWIAGGVFIAYAVGTTHDYFAQAQAKLKATQETLNSGVSRESIMSGFEFDMWTQAERAGHVNSDQLEYPADAYKETENCNGAEDLQSWWRSMTPEVKARYVISISPVKGLVPTKFPAVEYWRWLPLQKSRIYVGEVNPVLVCDPGSGE